MEMSNIPGKNRAVCKLLFLWLEFQASLPRRVATWKGRTLSKDILPGCMHVIPGLGEGDASLHSG